MELNKYIDHTNLKVDSIEKDIEKLCEEAVKYKFASVCIPPCYVEYAANLLKENNIEICTVVGFPLGFQTTAVKEFEAIEAINNGATEIDMVININALKNGDYDYVKKEIEDIRDSIDGKTLKIIIETCYLTEEEIIKMTEICNETFVNFIKTSTGFGERGANLEDIAVINKYKNEILEIKASGNIKDYESAISFIEAGVTRIGTSSAINIMTKNKCSCGNEKCKCDNNCN